MILPITEEYDRAFEEELKAKVIEVEGYYTPAKEYSTLDGEWTQSELEEDIYDVCVEVMTDNVINQYKYRALKNKDLLKPNYMAETLKNEIEDVVVLYNTEYDKHRNEKIFGIHWYDMKIKQLINRRLKENLVK